MFRRQRAARGLRIDQRLAVVLLQLLVGGARAVQGLRREPLLRGQVLRASSPRPPAAAARCRPREQSIAPFLLPKPAAAGRRYCGKPNTLAGSSVCGRLRGMRFTAASTGGATR